MRKKIYPEEKCEIVRRVKAGEFSQRHAAELMGAHVASLQAWIRIYDSEGPEGFSHANNKSYSDKLKLQAVKEYLDGQGSMGAICKKNKIRGNAQLRDWIMMYNAHGDIARKKRGGGSYMKRGPSHFYAHNKTASKPSAAQELPLSDYSERLGDGRRIRVHVCADDRVKEKMPLPVDKEGGGEARNAEIFVQLGLLIVSEARKASLSRQKASNSSKYAPMFSRYWSIRSSVR